MDAKTKYLVDEYMRGGMTREQALAEVGVFEKHQRAEVDAGSGGFDYTDEQLIEMNGSLAVRAIHSALTSGKIDNTIMTAAVRAVQMLDEHKKAGKGTDPEDDMLAWVAQRKQEELSG